MISHQAAHRHALTASRHRLLVSREEVTRPYYEGVAVDAV
jgi:hypothetical protein